MLADGLRKLLLGTSAITAIVGTPDSRPDKKSGVWWVEMPEEALLPGIVLSQVSGAGIPTMDGPDPLHTARIQVSCYGETFADAKSLARAVRTTLEGYAGTLPDGTAVGQTILVSEMDAFEDAPNSFGCPVDFEFWYSES
jgi:hypothetical protein